MGFFSHKPPGLKPGQLADYLAKADRPVLVEFAERDAPTCRMEEPIFEQVLRRYAGRLKVIQIDVAMSAEDATRHNVSAVPAFLLFVNGEERLRLVGFQTDEELSRALDEAVPSVPSQPPD